MQPPTEEQLQRLPNWAQRYIQALEQDAERANQTLREWRDAQTEQPVSVRRDVLQRAAGLHDFRARQYVAGDVVDFRWAHVQLEVRLERGVQGRHGITLSWAPDVETAQMLGHGAVAFIPVGHMQARLITPRDLK